MLNEAIKKFQFWASTQLPELLSTQECHRSTDRQSDRAILEYAPSSECMIDDIKDKLIDVLELKPIYSGSEPNVTDGGRSCCLCSRSGSGMMIKVFIKTAVGNMVMRALVTVYDSLDIMVFDIAADLKRREQQGYCMIETPLPHLYAEFIK